mgnify:CR=1 FL=1
MKKDKIKIITIAVLSVFLIFLWASIVKDILNFIFKSDINKTLFSLIHLILIYAFILILWKTILGEYLNKNLFHKKK